MKPTSLTTEEDRATEALMSYLDGQGTAAECLGQAGLLVTKERVESLIYAGQEPWELLAPDHKQESFDFFVIDLMEA